jgi:hypothetical protein
MGRVREVFEDRGFVKDGIYVVMSNRWSDWGPSKE